MVFKVSVFRYGSSYLISNIAILILTIFWSKIVSIDISKLKKIIIYFVVVLFFILLSKNLIRILKNYDKVYYDHPWPKIYAEDDFNNKKISNQFIKIMKLYFTNLTKVYATIIQHLVLICLTLNFQ